MNAVLVLAGASFVLALTGTGVALASYMRDQRAAVSAAERISSDIAAQAQIALDEAASLRKIAFEDLERAEHKRRSVSAAESRMKQVSEEGNGGIQSREEYLAHLHRGGPVLPDVEARLGL